jgi:hypothetical protein
MLIKAGARPMSSLTLSMKMSPKDTGRLFSKACRLEDENKQLRARVAELEGTINAVGEAFGTGSAARTRGTLVTCAENTVKFTKCLDAVERFFMMPGEPDEDYPDCEVDDVCLLNHWANSPDEYAEQFRVEILRKQAEAVEECATAIAAYHPLHPFGDFDDYVVAGMKNVYDFVVLKAQHLRNDAAKAGGGL